MATLEEKIAFYAERGLTRENSIAVDPDHPDGRMMTQEEFLDYLSVQPDPEEVAAQPSDELMECWQKRIPEYPKDQWQIFRLVKALTYMFDNGVDIGPEGEELVEAVRAVKLKYPKPE